MFIDEVKITVKSGNGGHGCMSFHRERHMPKGGPDGGDGGKGGDVIFEVDDSLTTLHHLRFQTVYPAQNGLPGEGKKKSGKKGEPLVIKVPRGTVIKEQGSDDLIVDFNMEVDSWQVLEGGKGGRGNSHFKSAVRQTPREFEFGKEGDDIDLLLSLKLIADVGFVGFPNAGKSSLLSRISAARPKVANYPFTTMTPHLGTHHFDSHSQVVFADIPGLIEGASSGKGLGISFLKHVERTKMILHLVEPFHSDGESPVAKVLSIRNELKQYSEALAAKKEILVLTKTDLNPSEEEILEWEKELGEKFYKVSTATGSGVSELMRAVHNSLEELEDS
ncbi:MAG: GTPase ObgE [Planctomycetes bacterium]|nr:GTPase ObgE [Planctomycetota bacterium]